MSKPEGPKVPSSMAERVANLQARSQALAKVKKTDDKKTDDKKPADKKSGDKPHSATDKPKPKRQKTAGVPSIGDRRELLSGFMRATVDDQIKKTGQRDIYVGGEAACMMIGVPLPSFALEYLLGLNILPFGIVMLLVGEEGLGKSGLSFEIARWFRRLTAGYVLYLENESKYSASWAKSIIGWDDPEAMKIVRCRSMQDWQQILQDDVTKFQEFCVGTESKPGPGKVFGYLQILDTLMGKSTPESAKRIQKEGFAGRAHPDEARSITQLLRTYPQRLLGWPAVFLILNQLKVKAGENGRTVREMAGGQGVKFQVSYQLELKRNPTVSHLRRGSWSISRLQLRSYKNSFAEDFVRKSIPINVCVRTSDQLDAETGKVEPRQQTVWDWYGATTELLTSFQEGKVRTSEMLRAAQRKKLKDLLPLKVVRGGRYWCEPLGVSRDEPVSGHAIGRLIQNNHDILRELRDLFGVQVWPGFDPSVTYDQQIDAARKVIAGRLQKISPSHVLTTGFDKDMDQSTGDDGEEVDVVD